METVELTQQQSARMTELPENYRVVGADHRAPLVRKPTGQIIRIQQNCRLTTSWSRRATALRSSSGQMAGCCVCNLTAAWCQRSLSRGRDPISASASSDDDDG